ncbi:TPA: acetyltransferase [Vibrio cholerae]|nr:acetyltransferase [Vibrio cholerae]
MVTVVVVEFGVMRCQPLRRALCYKRIIWKNNQLDNAHIVAIEPLKN